MNGCGPLLLLSSLQLPSFLFMNPSVSAANPLVYANMIDPTGLRVPGRRLIPVLEVWG